MILIAYLIGGFFGIAMLGSGLVCTPITLLSINFMGGVASDAFLFAKIARVYGRLTDRLFKVAWPSRNYAVYIQTMNAGGVFIGNFVAIGAILALTKIQGIIIWRSFTFFGFLYGSGLAYLLKGQSI